MTPPSRSRVFHRNLRSDPPIAVAGRGVWLVDRDGREVLDGSSGAAVSCLGHGHPRVAAAIREQAMNYYNKPLLPVWHSLIAGQ